MLVTLRARWLTFFHYTTTCCRALLLWKLSSTEHFSQGFFWVQSFDHSWHVLHMFIVHVKNFFPQNLVLFHSSMKQRTWHYTLNKLQEGFFKNRTSFRSFPLKLLSIQFLKVSHTHSIKFTSSNLIKSGQTFAATTLDKKLYKINHSIFFVCCVTLNPVIHNSLWILRGIKLKKGLTCIWCKWKTVKG